MNPKQSTRLGLNRETLRVLRGEEPTFAAGGGNTQTCSFRCPVSTLGAINGCHCETL
ncbi:MAG: hypothetical protein U0P81_06005 [Holophagaceae bacterium]